MAVPMTRKCLKITIKHLNGICLQSNQTTALNVRTLIKWRAYSTSKSGQVEKDPEELFLKPEVQNILKKITGFNLDNVFRTRQVVEMDAPKYKLLTDKQLNELKEESLKKGEDLLQMPPIMKPWNTNDAKQIISVDKEIENYELTNAPYVFTDISNGLPRRHRVVVVRELNGVLRMADHDQRDRILQVYFPSPGKMYHVPKLFEEEYLEKVLGERRYEYVLDRACIQFEPDDPNYIRVTQRTYEHIASEKLFEDLRSTRHFGPMSFYFAFYKKIDALLLDMLQRDLLSDGEALVRLYHIMHPECTSALESHEQNTSGANLIMLFAKHEALNGGVIEMALQSYEESSSRSVKSKS